ncbi:MAG: thiol peroxidase [Armatimonadetes bacterium]|nr:thiol peroxidase [Armatimonadota bacterium]
MSRSVRMRGNPLPLEGPELKPGDKAPDFRLHQATKEGLKDVTLEDFKGKTLLLSAVPSLDTSVCATATKKFNEEAGDLPDNVRVLVVSADLPFAQARFCGDNRISAVDTASDHRDVSFAQAYGVLIPPSRVLARAVKAVQEGFDVIRVLVRQP